MKYHSFNPIPVLLAASLTLVAVSCKNNTGEPPQVVLAKVGDKNITVEDMPLALGISGNQAESDKSEYPSLKAELSDQAVQRVIAALKLKREVLKRLSAILQKDPALRARLLAQGQQSKKIYREELTRLRNRQKELAEVLAAGVQPEEDSEQRRDEDESVQEQLPESQATALDSIMRRRLLKFANQAANSLGARPADPVVGSCGGGD